ncbi:hypothetical protein ERUR111494_06675 [Erysipelothrix urinaevulpis]|uniref:hypothetical protein n=1 Tax=Erysipelothrix urinaevulpis TaxID=2683717 RepID=UPI00135C7482|nr:hypothetical protein [Erysipelothrix urinaevulpis]
MKTVIIDAAQKANFNPVILKELMTYPLTLKPTRNPFTDLDTLYNCNDDERFMHCLDAFYLYCLTMKQKNIPSKIFYDTIYNFNHNIMKYYNEHQRLGIFAKDIKWLNLLFTEKIFKIHTLRFQIFPMDYAEMEREGLDYLPLSPQNKHEFPENTPMINVHIETGTDLSPQAVSQSFTMANEFFSQYYPAHTYQYFICRTWILHPSLNKLLDDNSNLMRFKNRFDLIATSQNYTQALERIYGTASLATISTMNKKGRLQEGAYRIYESLGVGIGIMKKEDIQ